jgi:serine protease AprX
MQLTHVFKPLFALLAIASLTLSGLPLAASAAPAPARLDDEVAQRIRTTPETDRIPVIVEGAASASEAPAVEISGPSRHQRAETSVRNVGGQVVGGLTLLGASVAELTPAEIRSLASDPSVGRIHIDAQVKAATFDEASGLNPDPTPITFRQTIGAIGALQTGQGVTVAVLDTGIDNHNLTAFGARVKARVDFIEPANPAPGDPAGHGTHVAGIIGASRSAPSPGVAPDASLVSVRVLDANGSSRLSTIIGGLEWVMAHKKSLDIRVVVMALGAPAASGYREDPLAAVAEMAWRSGLVVVTAAGNAGPGAGTIQTPAIDPLVLTVGADDENGTAARTDDLLPNWSSVGPTPDGLAKPDLLAPGRRIVSVRVPGSTLDLLSPLQIEGPTTIRFSGTSEAAAVAAGAAALVIQQRPELTPNQTKALLVGSARPLSGVAAAVQGAGVLDVKQALADGTQREGRSHLAPAEGFLRLLLPQLIGPGNQLVDGDHVRWDDARWDAVRWDGVRWDAVRWDGVRWDGVRWDGVRWDGVRWDGVRWDGVRWDQILLD